MQLPLLLVAILALAFSTDSAVARKRQSCDAVQRLAEIEFDPTLIVTLARDNDRHTCVFYVSLPPSAKASEPVRRAAAAFQPGMVAPASVAVAIASDLTEGLLAPLKEERFQSTPWKALEQAVRSRRRLIEICAGEIMPARSSFKSMDDVIACGVTGDETKHLPQARLAIQASLGTVAIAVLMPPAN
jgi:hypothetical protein